ncbi:MAG: UDPGP type 1 family protein [Planctomycetes bacterium]|nr:UDPGP type 1 family protein [Planctomycetota bacterium]
MEEYKKTVELLRFHGQGHLLAFYDQLTSLQKQQLLDEINALDFSVIPYWIENYVKTNGNVGIPDHFEPAPSHPPASASAQQSNKYDQARLMGVDLISAGKVAAFVVAGGQGTRLGFDGPKGDFPIGPVSNKTLFGIFAETILAARKKYDTPIPWYIMTSPLNHAATVDIFESNDYFGLGKSDVSLFQQGANPNFATDGKILLADKCTIASSPDGHGGSLRALYKSGALADMKTRGIEQISYWQVDNPLINIFDPLFIGLHALDGAEMSSKALVKAHPMEKVGNFCLVDGKVAVIEYSDLPDEQAHRRNPDGSLVFELGSIAIHVISTAFIEKLNAHGFALPIHRAVKKVPHIDAQGNRVVPTEPNGIKLETFVFDALPLAEKSIILQTVRSEEFAPVKNATGDDSPEVTRRMMIARAADWLEAAGVKVPRTPDGTPDCILEIAPSFALHREDVAEKADQIPAIMPGDQLYLA